MLRVLALWDFRPHFPHNYWLYYLHQGPSTCGKMFNREIVCLNSIERPPDILEMAKSVANINFSRYPKSFFTKTTGWISSIKTSINKFFVSEDYAKKIPMFFTSKVSGRTTNAEKNFGNAFRILLNSLSLPENYGLISSVGFSINSF